MRGKKTLGFAEFDLNVVVKNDVLGKYIVAAGDDGYTALLSLGEVDGVPLGSSGFARFVAPKNAKAGHWVSNLLIQTSAGAGPPGHASPERSAVLQADRREA